MLQLRNLLRLQPSSAIQTASLSPLFPLHRLLSTNAATPAAAAPFAVEDYLAAACGLTAPQAHKAAKQLSHLSSPSRADAVLAFLSAHGVSPADVAALVASDPKFLCADPEKNLAKRVAELVGLGLSRPQIARLIPAACRAFRFSSLSHNLGFWIQVFGSSFDGLLRAIKVNNSMLTVDLDKVAKPNLALLQQCGMTPRDFPDSYLNRVLTRLPGRVQSALVYIDRIGVRRNSPMFRYALMTFAVQSQETLDRKTGILETLGWSQDQVAASARKMPGILAMSEERLRRNADFLATHVGLEIPYIARRPALVMYSLERRLSPRHSLLKILSTRGLLDAKPDFYSTVALTEKRFLDKYVRPYEESIPGLATTYASSCAAAKVTTKC